MIDVALHYARSGWPVFPLAPGGKVPVVPGRGGCLAASTSVAHIEAWWTKYSDANIGIATGRRSCLLVVDIDPRKTPDWLASVNALKLPQTFTVRTASGGWHLYFAYPTGSKISIGSELLPGIDWRGDGGYVVAAGSIVNGVTYSIARSCPIAEAPATLIERICARKKLARPLKDQAGHMVIPDGSRNETLFALACLLRRFGIEYNAILESLRAANADHCRPVLEDEELRAIAASAMKYTPCEAAARDAAP